LCIQVGEEPCAATATVQGPTITVVDPCATTSIVVTPFNSPNASPAALTTAAQSPVDERLNQLISSSGWPWPDMVS
jgi:hypothetical protein